MPQSFVEHVSPSGVEALEGQKEHTESFTTQTKDFSEGGLRAWSAVVGSFCIMFCTFGYSNTWGLLMFPCVAQITPDPEQIGTYLGMALFVVAIAALTGTPICGAMIDHYGSFTQVAAFSGASVMFGAVLMFLLRLRVNKSLLVPV
ncbi:Monocarboxylate transporter [Aspergillus terreus]|uniref:Monocarboxylate transporter n=1 Tax=Aspergillus terreus TaxID=33178 RepID=A0A5M3YLQ9_ASPTE|nr:hypothetical protein ATETN484_0001049800 [Aspergillus terreus]GFF12354.1 Monocarboxylate transporter [Aspergillus terreus]